MAKNYSQPGLKVTRDRGNIVIVTMDGVEIYRATEEEHAMANYPIGASGIKPAPKKYSLVDVTLKDGAKVEVTIDAGIGVAEHLSRSMKETGMLLLRNGTQATAIAASEVAMFSITQITLEE